jgi:NADPH2 dehydrogenase
LRHYPRIASLKTVEEFRTHLAALHIDLPVDDVVESAPASPLAAPISWEGRKLGNRWCVLPMEGWDGCPDGAPSELTERRWVRFGGSGAKLVWGGEAVAVCREGRANPNQLWINAGNVGRFASLREKMAAAHEAAFGRRDDLVIGLQLTHSGRYCRPNSKAKLEPRILYHHPVLDRRLQIDPSLPVLTDDEIRRVVDHFIEAASLAACAGFDFVDIKHCHGYLGHEFLSAVDRPGPYGGPLQNRTRFLREIVQRIHESQPGLGLAVRLSAFDTVPYRRGQDGTGEPEPVRIPYKCGFGCDPGHPEEADFREPGQFVAVLKELGISLVCVSAGSPYYNPHVQRPALFPPSDGYDPPEDPTVGVVRQVAAAACLKRNFPEILIVGSGLTYLQDYLPNVAQACIRKGWMDFAGLGRMMLSYPEMPADVMAGKPLSRSRLCRTFSDCTTAPRNGLVSGCYPLDPFYRGRTEAAVLKEVKAQLPKPG